MNDTKSSSGNTSGGTAHPPSRGVLVNQPEPLAYDSLSEFEKARFDKQLREQFDVSRKKARLVRTKGLRKLRHSFHPDTL